ncbi:cupin domain-containing protein [Gracilibacillus saliphilus]|uniref:cupin domain-containing protein n=1 Tax=Gracilibacillus saliphilus TaxID=543890 RepID=UPI0013D23C24|nr:cupin domain-containing protein [Gracilibacillus saliphilus]
MYNNSNLHPNPPYLNQSMYNNGMCSVQSHYTPNQHFQKGNEIGLIDYGSRPLVFNINEVTKQNNTFRTAIWTGSQFQITLMSIGVGEDIGIEMHPAVDQFLRIEQGQGIAQMGTNKNHFNFERYVYDDTAIVIPAGTWHNVINTGTIPLKLYSIYAPPNHPFNTVHVTKRDAMAVESHHHNGNVS